jgi:putative oxidoreductase
MIPDLLGAIALVHAHAGFFFTNDGGGWEYPGFWAIALLVLALSGDGKWAIKQTHSSGSTSH